MARIGTWWQRHRPSTRRLIQLYTAVLYNANLKGFIKGDIFRGSTKAVCTPGLNCYSCPGAVGACPLGALQNALATAKTRAGWYALGTLLLFGVIFGRTICGFFCPVGMLQELLYKIPGFKIRKSRITRILSYLKYLILILFAILIPLWSGLFRDVPLPAFCKYICPAGTLEGAGGLLANPANQDLYPMLGSLFIRKCVILLLVILACIFCYRSFCRFLCPLGAIYSLFNRVSIIGIKVDQDRCTHCGACAKSCPMDVRCAGDHECISCGRCQNVCSRKAIALKCGRTSLNGEKYRRIGWTLALVLLAGALLYFNLADPKESSTVPIGYEAGQQLEDFSIPLVGEDTFRLSEHRGQVVFLNLWATWCGPCVDELDDFSRLRTEHPEIEVLAVHSAFVTEDVEEYLKGRDWNVDAAIDTEEEMVFRIVNGSTLLPQTIVLNPRGEVIYNQVGSVTYELLTELLQEAQQS